VLGYPSDDATAVITSQEEKDAIQRAVAGEIPIQYLPVKAEKGEPAAQMSFIATFENGAGELEGVLVGRSDLTVNPFAQPLLTSLKSMSQVGGEGILLDENERILYNPNPDLVMATYDGALQNSSKFFEDTSSDGTRQFVYYQPAVGRQWSVVLTAPALYVQEQALSIAAPLLATIIIASLIAVGVFRLSLRVVTASLQNLAVEADRLAKGQLDQPLRMEGEDEVGQLRRAFEKMRAALKARLDELNRLLVVSQGVASTLELEGSLRPVLESALMTGATSARVALDPALVPEQGGETSQPLRFGAGSSCELYGSLDDQILALTHRQEKVLLTNLSRPRFLTIAQGLPRPYALLALALRHENRFYGALWIAYDEPHQFSDEEVRFISTLAGQAALAASNARLFLTAEIGRQRLEAILSSTPDPVLVTDEHDCLLLSNPAAWHALGFDVEAGQGRPVDQVLSQQQLIDLLRSSSNENQSAEIVLQAGSVYLATASSVLADDRRMGRICVLRDVTHFKEIDSLKSDFVSTVSHDLRSPLTLIRGYATMLQMVGELNEQQAGYIQKIVNGVESMSKLVNNLLDLGRIEAGVGLQLENQPVKDLMANVVAPLQLQADQKRIHLITEIQDEADILVEADQALLQQALHNLVENAIKYTEAGGEVRFCYHQQNDQIVFEVQDTGIGIAPADQQRLFEKFYRSSRKGIRSERGSGLGLSIVKSIAERHGGRVWFESQLGKGSIFSMLIPLNQNSDHH
jgi:signal transduction histidine kinase/HAMP domain-containing protein